ncbi:FAD-dependent monooxygenase [Alphaproteobacteria bacterium KMM 3653]|uniref:FAD-dependent monooxygenase n=1 Tax=Harenicola maris TaxID=2841044 RepID=A0AAP2CR28_9RHOB|nr:FAD-dependent monooxygenase [Harenicola maris]
MTQKIAIAGAGIGGLAAAALLAQSGREVTLFDQFDAPRPVGSGLVIQPVGAFVLDECGAGEEAARLGNPIKRMLGHEVEQGRVTLDVSYSRRGKPGQGLAIHRASLFHVLWQSAQSAGAHLECSSDVTAAPLENGKRWVEVAGKHRFGPFDLVIDASGVGSPLSGLRGAPLPYGAIWGNVPWPEDTPLPRDHLSQRYLRASHMVGVLPIGRMPQSDTPLAAIFWSMPAGSHAGWCGEPLQAWKDEAEALWPEFAPFLETITRHDQMTMARYSHATLRRPVSEAMAHIGDAAHRTSPQLGQGANMALLDAYALAYGLLSANGANPVEEALLFYHRARRYHVRIYQAMSAAFTPQYQSDSRALPLLRDRVLQPLSTLPPIPGILTRLVCGDMIRPVVGQPYAGDAPLGLAHLR